MTEVAISAPAKVILFGEHAVVYGQPAIAVPVPARRAEAVVTASAAGSGLCIQAMDLNEILPISVDTETVDNALILTAQSALRALEIDQPPDAIIALKSTIPVASGLGSGAAVSAVVARAVAQAVGKTFDRETLNELVYEIEKVYHGTPSGIDNTVIVYESAVYFVRHHPIEFLNLAEPITLVIADTGHPAPTRITVGDVRKLYEHDPANTQPLFDQIGDIVNVARAALERGDLPTLGRSMLINHDLLRKLTVSSNELDDLVDVAMKAGALGAKLSGGGRGGNMIALVDAEHAEVVRSALLTAGAADAFITVIP